MLIIKFLGLCIVVAVCSSLGFLKAQSVKERAKKLSFFCEGLITLHEYIEQGGMVLDKAVNRSFNGCDFLNDNDLKKEDKNLINEFFTSLGYSPKKVECEHIKNFGITMQKRLNEAEAEVTQKSKIYSVFGICIGLGLAVLLI